MVGLAAGDHVDDLVGELDAADLRAGAADAGRAAVVPGDRRDDLGRDAPALGEEGAGECVVDAEALALEQHAVGALGRLGGELVARVLAEGDRQHVAPDVVQQAAQVRRVAVGPDLLGRRGGDGRDGDRVQVQLAAGAARARRALEEAVGGGLQRELAQRLAPDEHDRLAHGLGADGARHRR